MSKLYLRVTPYDKAKGALCQRYTVAGRTYVAGQWYGVDPDLASLLREEKQATGCPVFEILNEAEWREKARAEVYARLMVHGSVLPGAAAPPAASKPPKTGPVAGKYDRFRKHDGVEEVDPHTALAPAERANVADVAPDPAPADDDDDPGELNLNKMSKAELIATAEEYEVDLSPLGSRPSKEDIRAHLEKAIFE